MKKSKDEILSELFDEYTEKWWAGEPVNAEKYVKQYPEYADELKKDIEDWEWLMEMIGTKRPLSSEKEKKKEWKKLLPRLREIEQKKKAFKEAKEKILVGAVAHVLAIITISAIKRKIRAVGEEKPKFEIKFQKPHVLVKNKEVKVTSGVIDNKLVVWLSSEKYKITKIKVSLCKIGKSGKREILITKIADENGMVDFGEVFPGKYAIVIPNLQEIKSK